MNAPLRIGTRGSQLALWQANFIADRLRLLSTHRSVELEEIQTEGDRIQNVPLAQIGGQGVFTKEIQRALLAGKADVAVHSLKDLPTIPVEGLILAAVPARAPAGDAFLSRKHRSFDALPPGARVATSSQRRRALVLHRRPDLNLVEIRGNVDTRLRKLTEQDLDGLLLARAGLERLGLAEQITDLLDLAWMVPAVGQGALGLECRADDTATRALLAALDDPPTHLAVLAERAFLRGLGGGCQLPIAGHAHVQGGRLELRGVVLSPDGKQRLADELTGDADSADSLGQQLADRLLARGARELLAGNGG
jgi:hydroxymethylbilane synthase